MNQQAATKPTDEPTDKVVYTNLSIIRQNLLSFYSSVLGIFILVFVAVMGYWVAFKQERGVEAESKQVKKIIAAREQSLFELNQQLNFLRVELEVEKLANQNIQQTLKDYKTENTELKRQLTFYQNVMAPEMFAEGVIADEVSILPTSSENRFRYRIVLVQTRKNKQFAKGKIEVVLHGQQNDHVSRYNLAELALKEDADFKFSFRYFEVLEGEFELKENFQPERIQLSVVMSKTRWQKYSRVETEHLWQPQNIQQD